MRRSFLVLTGSLALACGGGEPAPPPPAPTPATPAPLPRPPLEEALLDHLPEELLRQANHGRLPLGEDDYFAFPAGVTRVWVDVGAHHLETTRRTWERQPDMALIAVEPLAECWPEWPDDPRLVGIPAALYLERGEMEFHVNAMDVTSSLAATRPDNPIGEALRTVEVRQVPVLRLEDLLERIPPELTVEFVKTDVQGVDLQVLRSAGELLRRVERVRAEIINEAHYEDVGDETTGTEQEFVDYMAGMGFRFAGDVGVVEDRRWLDKDFVNEHRVVPPS